MYEFDKYLKEGFRVSKKAAISKENIKALESFQQRNNIQSITDLAKKLGCSRAYIYMLRQGKRKFSGEMMKILGCN